MRNLLLAILLFSVSAHAQRADTSSVSGTPSLGDAPIFDGTQFAFQPPPIGGTSNNNRLVSGCGVTYTTGLSYVVAPCNYVISGVSLSSALTTVTLTAADGTNPRIDALIVDSTGVPSKVTGSAAASPAAPSIDPTSQLQLTTITVLAAATTPSSTFLENVYLENTEWTCAASDGSNNCASTNNPFAGTKDIEGTTSSRADNVTLTRTTPIVLSNYNSLSFYIRSKATWGNNCNMSWTFQLGGVQQGTSEVLSNGAFGFVSSQVASYQLIVIPISAFGVIGQADRLTFTITGAGSCSLGYYIDNIILQGGITNSRTVSGIYPVAVSSTGVVSCEPCQITGTGSNTLGGFIGGSISASDANAAFGFGGQAATSAARPSLPTTASLSGPTLCLIAAKSGFGQWGFVSLYPASAASTAISFQANPTVINNDNAVGCYGQTASTFLVQSGQVIAANGANTIAANLGVIWSSQIVGSSSQPFVNGFNNTIGIAANVFTAPGQGRVNPVTTTDEQLVQLPVPDSLILTKICASQTTANAAGGSDTFTTRKNASSVGGLVVTKALSSGIGRDCTTGSVSYSAGDLLSVNMVNNNGAAVTGTLTDIELDTTPTGTNQIGILSFPKGNVGLTASQTRYTPLFSNEALTVTDLEQWGAIPYSGVLKNLRCYQKTAPAATTTVGVYVNGSPTGITISLTNAAGANVVLSDTTHSFNYTNNQPITLQWVSGAGAVGVWSGCTIGVYRS